MTNVNELKDALKDTLEEKGILNQIRALMRKSIFEAIESDQQPTKKLSDENLIINELIREYLTYNNYLHSNSVFLAETGQPNEPFDRNFIAKELGISEDASSRKVPLLYSICFGLKKEVPNIFDNNNNINNNNNMYSNINPMSLIESNKFVGNNNNNNMNINNNNFNNFRRKSVQYYPHFNFLNFPIQNPPNFQNMNNPFMVNTNINNYNAFNNVRNISIPIQNNKQTKTQKKRNSFNIPVPNNLYYEDSYILDNLNSYLTDQTRCRQIQEKLEEKKNDSEFINKFYQNIESNLVDIINHQFGNYVIQKFFDVILFQKNQNLISQFFSKIQSDLFKISVNNYGTRVFQKSLEKLDNGIYEQIETPELNNIIKNLVEKHIFALCYDKNGNHVFQKIARIFPKDRNQFIFDLLNQYAIEISKLKQGATILQNTFKYASSVQLKSLILKILSDIGALVNDEYGNYTIQLIIELKEKEYNDIIYDYLIKNCLPLSKKKFSSNVIDKCIIGEDENSKKLVNCIIKNKYVKEMINDQFGNYVIQKALKVSDYDTQVEIINQIKPQIEQLRQTNIGRKIYEHLMQSYNEFFKNTSE
jgi:hypothetical protein